MNGYILRLNPARLATWLLTIGAATASLSAVAATYQYRVYIPGVVASPTSSVVQPQAVREILVALSGGLALPAGTVKLTYNYDLNQLLSVTGDPAFSASGVDWSTASGSLPPGLTLGANGVISGVPTTPDAAGSSFEVLATYKTKAGQRAYTIAVNGAVLQVTQLSARNSHACAVTVSGGVKCWGYNASGQLGDGSTTRRLTPVDVGGLTSGVASISAGDYHTCAVTVSGGVKCWGFNFYGQLGDNSTYPRLAPIDVDGLASGVASVSAGSAHTCAVTVSGGAKCWGQAGWGQLGNSAIINGNQLTPVDVDGLTSGVASISSGVSHTCAVTTSGGAKCWGYNSNGQIGDGNGSAHERRSPVDVVGLTSGVASISVGYSHTCALTTAGGAKCWGRTYYGQLGDDMGTDQYIPSDVAGLASGVVHISTTYDHTCAVTASGGAKCWGHNNYGQLGDGSATLRRTPVDVVGLTSGVTSISAGWNHTCALTAAGGKCWGRNHYGQLGDNSTTNRMTPVGVNP